MRRKLRCISKNLAGVELFTKRILFCDNVHCTSKDEEEEEAGVRRGGGGGRTCRRTWWKRGRNKISLASIRFKKEPEEEKIVLSIDFWGRDLVYRCCCPEEEDVTPTRHEENLSVIYCAIGVPWSCYTYKATKSLKEAHWRGRSWETYYWSSVCVCVSRCRPAGKSIARHICWWSFSVGFPFVHWNSKQFFESIIPGPLLSFSSSSSFFFSPGFPDYNVSRMRCLLILNSIDWGASSYVRIQFCDENSMLILSLLPAQGFEDRFVVFEIITREHYHGRECAETSGLKRKWHWMPWY